MPRAAEPSSRRFAFRPLAIAAAAALALTFGSSLPATAQTYYAWADATNPVPTDATDPNFSFGSLQVGNGAAGSFSALAGAQMTGDRIQIGSGLTGNGSVGIAGNCGAVLDARPAHRHGLEPCASGHLGHRDHDGLGRGVGRRSGQFRRVRVRRELWCHRWQWRGVERNADHHRHQFGTAGDPVLPRRQSQRESGFRHARWPRGRHRQRAERRHAEHAGCGFNRSSGTV